MKKLKITTIELACIILIVGVVCVAFIVNRPSSDVSELSLKKSSELPLEESESQHTDRLAKSQVSDWSNSQKDWLEPSNPEPLVEGSSEDNKSSEKELGQFEAFLSEFPNQTSGQEIIEENPLQKAMEEVRKVLASKVREALAEAKRLMPIVRDYEDQRKKIASKKAEPQQIKKELDALKDAYRPYVTRLQEIYPLVTDVEIQGILGDWVQEEAAEIFGTLGW